MESGALHFTPLHVEQGRAGSGAWGGVEWRGACGASAEERAFTWGEVMQPQSTALDSVVNKGKSTLAKLR